MKTENRIPTTEAARARRRDVSGLCPRFAILLWLMLSAFNAELSLAQGTTFTYQGQLNNGGAPASGVYDFVFAIYDLPTGNGGFANYTNAATPVSNGLFTVALDLGLPGIFTGPDRWLEINVRTNGNGAFATLSPRQKLTPTPYAITAGSVVSGGIAGTYSNAVTFNNSSNSFSGDGSSVSNVNALTVGGIGAAGFWKATGNAGTIAGPNFLGTADNEPLEIQVNGVRALRIEPQGTAAANLVGGYYQNSASGSQAAAIAGGGTSGSPNYAQGNYAFIGAGHGARAGAFSAVVDGAYNDSSGQFSFIGSGGANTNLGGFSFIGSGSNNLIQAGSIHSFIGGGSVNTIQSNASYSIIGGGNLNQIESDSFYSTIGGGTLNTIETNASGSVIAGGTHNAVQSNAYGSMIGAGIFNTIQTNAYYSVIGGGYNNIIETNAVSGFIGGGFFNTIETNVLYSTIGGGEYNAIRFGASSSTISGGNKNVAQGNAIYAVIAGGIFNTNNALGATVSGGGNNDANAQYSTVAGGYQNNAIGAFSVLSGGYLNSSSGSRATVPGGYLNSAAGDYSFAAGQRAKANHQGAFVWADSQNADFVSAANDQFLIRAQGGVGINKNNPASTLDVNGTARIQGANNWDVTDSEGDFRVGNDTYRFKIGVAIAGGGAGDVWMRAHGGTGRVFLKTPGGTTIFSSEGETNGVSLAAGGGAWSSVSDRNAKENFIPVDTRDILQRVASLPLTSWNYKSQEKSIRHIGPMAQDFAAAFQVGEDDRHITTIDSEGVALAAIQGLNEKMEAENGTLRAENAELKTRLERLERLVHSRDEHGE